MTSLRKTSLFIISMFLLCSCSLFKGTESVSDMATSQPSETKILTNTAMSASDDATITPTPFQPIFEPDKLFWSEAVPQTWVSNIGAFRNAVSADSADLVLSATTALQKDEIITKFQRIYAVGVPFPTVTDEVSLLDIISIWQGESSASGEFNQLYMTTETLNTFEELWGSPSIGNVKTVSEDALLEDVWNTVNALALIPFEDIQPKYKILKVDGISPLDRPMNVEGYGLKVDYTLSGKPGVAEELSSEIEQLVASIPATNRDESKMAVVVMSGTTALARVTLRKIELNGVEYPVDKIKEWFLTADLRHVSNEVSFNEECEYTDAYTMQFCSKPEHIAVLENLGVNVVESTGNHLVDYGVDYFRQTLAMYAERNWLSFGGGYDAESAKQPAFTEVNGNKIAFIGCNPAGPATDWATETRAGSANCDYPWFYQKISELKSQGYVVIATYQFEEISRTMYDEYYRVTFRDAAAAGADIVQGSQSHVPMGFEFEGNSLIHYGLGNLLFDQMEPENIREFVDRHILYNGEYIGTELLTATLTDWSRPVPMSESKRQQFLTELFADSKMR